MKKARVTILQTSDLHGKIFPKNPYTNKEDGTGLLKAATFIQKERSKQKDLLVIDNGDLFQGTPLMYHHMTEASGELNPMILGLNYLEYDAFILGNHEFNYGQNLLRKAQKESQFPWLSANIVCEKTGKPFFGTPYIIKTFKNGLKIGILGLTTELVPLWENPAHIKGMKFLNIVETAKQWVRYLKEEKNVDCLVISYHGGIERNGQTKENQGDQLCKEVKGIDVLLTGHQHRLMTESFANDVLVIQPGKNGSHIGKVQLEYEKTLGTWSCVKKKGELVDLKGSLVDENLQKQLILYKKETDVWLDEPLGEVIGDMTVPTGIESRLKPQPYVDFINRVQSEVARVEISLTSIFKNNTPGFKGQVTMRDILANYIYPNSLKVLRVTGQDIKAALEQSASYFTPYGDGQVKVSDAFLYPKEEPYNYDIWKGIDYEINITRPIGKRITKLRYKGEAIHSANTYLVVMNNYRASGAGNYEMFGKQQIVKDIQISMIDLLADYFKKNRTVQATTELNWRVIY